MPWATLIVRWIVLITVLLPAPGHEPPDGGNAPTSAVEGTGADAVAPGEENEAASPDPADEADWDRRAEAIEHLTAGTLDLATDANEPFTVDLDALDGGADRWNALQAAVAEARAAVAVSKTRPRVTATPQPPTTPLMGRERFVAAVVTFLSLPADERQRRLDEHAARQQQAEDVAAEDAERVRQAAQLTAQAGQLEALVAGTLPPDVDPRRALRVDLLEPGIFETLEPGRASVDPDPDATDPIAVARRRLSKARAAWLALPAEERQHRLADHARRKEKAERPPEAVVEGVPPADEAENLVDPKAAENEEAVSVAQQEAAAAAEARDRALEAARQAKTEALRRVKEEKARLLGIREQQALYAAELSGHKEAARLAREKALEWSRRVTELSDAAVFADDVEARADDLYVEVRKSKAETREAFRAALVRLEDLGADIPEIGVSEEVDAELPEENDELAELRAAVEENALKLRRVESEIDWEVASSLRDDLVTLNKARLHLLNLTSDGLADRFTGLTAEGVEQVRYELDDIQLELRFHARALPRDVRTVFGELARDPVGVLWGALELLLIVVVFRAWRRHADQLLRGWYGGLRQRQQELTFVQRLRRRVFWYLLRIRKPLEWLLLLALFPYLFGSVERLPELRLFWYVATWLFGGFTAIMALDAIAERQSYLRFRESDTAELRLRSLRLLGITVTIVGLILSVTADIVGRGAIFAWMLRLCWVLVVPIGAWLVVKWREVIFERIASGQRRNFVVDWISANRAGLTGMVAATAGGLYLLGDGVRRWVVRQASQLDATRKLLAYLFRREVAKTAEARSEEREFTQRLPDSRCSPFAPEGPAEPCLEEIVREQFDAAVELTHAATTTLTAVVGERGLGKTTFLRRLLDRMQEKTCLISCPPDGFDALLEELSREFGTSDASADGVAEAIAAAGASTICIDDAQRMIEPTIGGLEDIDRFTRFAMRVGGDVSWVVAIDKAAWVYLNRARGDRVFFDQIVVLPRWTEQEIGKLIRKRTSAAGLVPDFDDLVVGARIDEVDRHHDRERTELGYYRILWDHSAGNPAVALLAWRRSLFEKTADGEPVVQLFEEPPAREIEKLPLTLLFVLRGIVQLDLASEAELASCTQLPLPDIAAAIRYSITHGYVEPQNDRYRITWPWYRTITTVLTRQHLLVA